MSTTTQAPVSADTSQAAPVTHDLSTWTADQREHWRNTGETPEIKKAESQPVEAGKSGTEPEAAKPEPVKKAAPASEADKPQESKKRSTAQDRKEELNREIRELLKQRDDLRKEVSPKDVKAEPSPAAQELKRPNVEEFDNLEKYEQALDAYNDARTQQRIDEAIAKDRAERAREQVRTTLQQQIAEAKGRYENFAEVINPALQSLTGSQAVAPAVKGMLESSPVMMDLLYTIGEDAAELADFVKLAETDPAKAIRKLVTVEALVMDKLRNGKSEAKEPEKKATPVKPKTEAPAPPKEVGGRGSATEDPAMAAAGARDVRGAFREFDRKAREGRLR